MPVSKEKAMSEEEVNNRFKDTELFLARISGGFIDLRGRTLKYVVRVSVTLNGDTEIFNNLDFSASEGTPFESTEKWEHIHIFERVDQYDTVFNKWFGKIEDPE